MQAHHLALKDVLLFEPRLFADQRGFFFESFNQDTFQKLTGLKYLFVQDNHSRSTRGVLRGLHYQLPPKAQGKLVRVIHGEIFDVVVDIRKDSATFGEWIGEILSADNKKQLWIPPGFAHGFLTLSETAEMLYKTTEYYAPEFERSIKWNDPSINIQWPFNLPHDQLIIAAKDANGFLLTEME